MMSVWAKIRQIRYRGSQDAVNSAWPANAELGSINAWRSQWRWQWLRGVANRALEHTKAQIFNIRGREWGKSLFWWSCTAEKMSHVFQNVNTVCKNHFTNLQKKYWKPPTPVYLLPPCLSCIWVIMRERPHFEIWLSCSDLHEASCQSWLGAAEGAGPW